MMFQIVSDTVCATFHHLMPCALICAMPSAFGACQTHWHTCGALGYERILHHILKLGVASVANHVHYFPCGEFSSEETCS